MMNFDSHTIAHEGHDRKIRSWHVPTLWEHVKDFEVIEIDLECVIKCINKFINSFNADDWDRVGQADLSYPIIINDTCGIVDGCHRTVRAALLGMDKINAVRIIEFPEPQRIWDNWTDYDNNP